MSLTVHLATEDLASEKLRELSRAVKPSAQLHRAMAEKVKPIITRNFQRLSVTQRNPFGATSSGFWQRMIGGTRARADAAAGYIDMPREVAQRFHGGTITPSGGRKFLTIPARAEAYGKSARQFDDLHFVPTRRGGMLVRNVRTRLGRGKNRQRGSSEAGGETYFWLVKSVTQRADKSVLPPAPDVERGALRGLETYLEGRVK